MHRRSVPVFAKTGLVVRAADRSFPSLIRRCCWIESRVLGDRGYIRRNVLRRPSHDQISHAIPEARSLCRVPRSQRPIRWLLGRFDRFEVFQFEGFQRSRSPRDRQHLFQEHSATASDGDSQVASNSRRGFRCTVPVRALAVELVSRCRTET